MRRTDRSSIPSPALGIALMALCICMSMVWAPAAEAAEPAGTGTMLAAESTAVYGTGNDHTVTPAKSRSHSSHSSSGSSSSKRSSGSSRHGGSSSTGRSGYRSHSSYGHGYRRGGGFISSLVGGIITVVFLVIVGAFAIPRLKKK